MATVLLLAVTARSAYKVQRVAVVVSPGADPLRSAAYVNGIELMLSQTVGLEMHLFETDGTPSSLTKTASRIAEASYCGVLTNLDQAMRLADCREIPVLTTGQSQKCIRTAADRDDEVDALLSYAAESGMRDLAIVLPETVQVWGSLLQWLWENPSSRLYTYAEQALSQTDLLVEIAAQEVDGILVWGAQNQAPEVISGLRHAGYTGAVLGPSFLADYEALGINAGQASGLRFAAQYTDPRHNAEWLTRRQQRFVQAYTTQFREAPLFAESYYGADQVLILKRLLDAGKQSETPLGALLQGKRIEGVAQVYDYTKNPRTGVISIIVYEIQSGHMEEAR